MDQLRLRLQWFGPHGRVEHLLQCLWDFLPHNIKVPVGINRVQNTRDFNKEHELQFIGGTLSRSPQPVTSERAEDGRLTWHCAANSKAELCHNLIWDWIGMSSEASEEEGLEGLVNGKERSQIDKGGGKSKKTGRKLTVNQCCYILRVMCFLRKGW